jgi:inorganic pyrophosphatase
MVGDGDPLDVCVLTEKPITHGGFLAHVRPIGGLRVVDADEADDKIIAVLEADLAFGHLRGIEDCPVGLIDRLQHYFLGYKQKPGDVERSVSIAEVYGRDEALEVIQCSLRDYQARYGAASAAMAARGSPHGERSCGATTQCVSCASNT